MHRLPRFRLLDLIVVVLATARKETKAKMLSKNPLQADQGRSEMATLICNQIDNDSSMVLVTEFIGEAHVAQRGKWGVDEPEPAVVPELVENRR